MRCAVASCFFFLVSTFPLHAQEDGQNLWSMIAEGGWAMWPLGACSLAMLTLIFHGYRETVRRKFIPQADLSPLTSMLQARQLEEAAAVLQARDTMLGRSLGKALGKAKPGQADAGKAKVEALLVDTLEAEEAGISRWINYLNVIAATAPMIGLLGTVSGMIGAFQTMERVGMGQPQAFAGSIGEALITTATGLIIGIPAMVFYFSLKNRLAALMTETVQAATDLLDALAGDEG